MAKMKRKNKLLISVTTTKIYEYNTNAETADLAFDEYQNQSGLKLKVVDVTNENAEVYDFIINKPKEKKK
jgi:hypothetical protein